MEEQAAKIRIDELREILRENSRRYYVDNAPTMSDFEFDQLMHELERLEAEFPQFDSPDSPTRRVGSDLDAPVGANAESGARQGFVQRPHRYPMLSLGNTYSLAEIEDFAARADWCVKPFKDANHQPEVRVAVSGGEPAPGQPLDISAKAGDVLTLSTAGTNDPDGDRLEIRWWYFADPSSYPGTLDILPAGKRRVRIQLPSDFLPGQTVHLVCEVTDDGTPSLTRYQRVVITGK